MKQQNYLTPTIGNEKAKSLTHSMKQCAKITKRHHERHYYHTLPPKPQPPYFFKKVII